MFPICITLDEMNIRQRGEIPAWCWDKFGAPSVTNKYMGLCKWHSEYKSPASMRFYFANDVDAMLFSMMWQ